MVVVFKELTLVSLLYDLVRPNSYLYLLCSVFQLRYSPCFRRSDKSSYALAQNHSVAGAHQDKLFSGKQFPLNSVLQIVKCMVLF